MTSFGYGVGCDADGLNLELMPCAPPGVRQTVCLVWTLDILEPFHSELFRMDRFKLSLYWADCDPILFYFVGSHHCIFSEFMEFVDL